MKGKQSTYKKKNLYIFIYRQKEKEGAKRHKKRGTKKSPSKNTIQKVSTTKAQATYWLIP